eukprot:scaffold11393_cov30-Tisochrysis_lutea.AAC.4
MLVVASAASFSLVPSDGKVFSPSIRSTISARWPMASRRASCDVEPTCTTRSLRRAPSRYRSNCSSEQGLTLAWFIVSRCPWSSGSVAPDAPKCASMATATGSEKKLTKAHDFDRT